MKPYVTLCGELSVDRETDREREKENLVMVVMMMTGAMNPTR